MTEWTFHLRPDARWSDGEPVTAADFIFAYHRMLSPGLAAAYAPMLHSIKNAEAYNRDLRGYILCGLDDDFPTPWETLKTANFDGDRKLNADDISNRNFSDLDHSQKKRLLASKGLDRLKQAHLEAIQADPTLFDWPAAIPAESRAIVVERLLASCRGRRTGSLRSGENRPAHTGPAHARRHRSANPSPTCRP